MVAFVWALSEGHFPRTDPSMRLKTWYQAISLALAPGSAPFRREVEPARLEPAQSRIAEVLASKGLGRAVDAEGLAGEAEDDGKGDERDQPGRSGGSGGNGTSQ